MDISIVIPLYNEEESLPHLMEWISRVMDVQGTTYEVILVDDGSNDSSWQTIEGFIWKYPMVRGIKFRRNYGKSAALQVGFAAAQGEVVITMDADMQDSPEEIPELYRMIKNDGYDLVSGWKKKRRDPFFSKRLPSKMYNFTVRCITGIKLHDMNCGLKAYHRNVVKSIEVYGEMHRYIPVLARQAGFKRIGEKVVQHQERKFGSSKFGWERYINGFLDLMSVTFVSRFGKRPMHFFGTLGSLMFLSGGLIAIWLIASKIWAQAHHLKYRPVTDQPLFYIALVIAIIGVQFFMAGFIGELVSRSSADRNQYLIEKDTAEKL
ncbi:MAG: glycosyltransferase family 2 protein [Tenuifilaceae bacterium]|jgi:glycosyltransferase involved in cell wall biosynthesis|nr:glycosyltransferase family 2 protein [Bacteroidales bacterium]MDI9516955.1 glycosyltransferase family 2 protein [Bacteroidota bacterium]NLH56977.1 glycosyltransferase family 2 protein [Rikenellaceae bacterium]OQC61113.1 MAG: Undecaprenyl-phosphate 4-deoxy-4-formamido-L-arabinose transferase [Bacteroidetes bacterium ADurb.Bin008]HNV81673.1 glycosyltransferase family 2 protein [Tenuifilaceae bacterium]